MHAKTIDLNITLIKVIITKIIIMTLSKILKSNKNARKIFGRKEIEIILKQMHGIALTQSERNRLSRDIRPKFEFIREVAEFKDEFRLKKDQDAKMLIEKAISLILGDKLKDKVEAIVLFGSRKSGNITPRSDIDICVIFSEIERNEADSFRVRILGNFPVIMDIQVFNTLPQKIRRSISISHKVLYKKDDFDNLSFSTGHLKDEDFFIRAKRIFGEAA